MSLAMESFARNSFAQFMTIYREVMEESGGDLTSCADLERRMWTKITGGQLPKGNKLPWALVKKIKVKLPYMPDIINYNNGCCGLKKEDGLYIPCGGKCEEEAVLCKACDKSGAKYGTLEDRGMPGSYMDPEDKHEITYGTWLAKKEKTIEEVNAAIAEAGFDFAIPESYLAVNAKRAEAKHRPGRPKAKKEVSESDSESESDEPKAPKAKKAPKKKSDDSESESEPKAKKATKKKSESESESDEPKEPKAKKAAKKAKSEDSESESEPKVKKAAKKAKSDDESEPKAKKAAKKAKSEDSESESEPKVKKATKKAKSDDESEPKAKKATKKTKSEDEPKAKKAPKKTKESDESGSESDAPKAKKSPKKVVEAAPEPSELQLDAEGFEVEDEDIDIDGKQFKLRDGRMVFNLDGEWVACIEEGEVNWRE